MWKDSGSSLFAFFLIWIVVQAVSSLNVYITPTYILKPAKSTIMLNCRTLPSGVPITWEKDEKEVPLYPADGKANGEIYTLANNSLYIKTLKRRQTGTYVCVASSITEKRFAKATVEIAYLQKFPTTIPPVIAYNGSPVEIECPEILGKPVPEVSWKRNGQPITDQRFTKNGWKLMISKLNLTDAGEYTCVAKNQAKERSVNITLDVIIPGKVVITPKSDEIKENENTSFQCVSLAVPPLAVEWKKVIQKCGLAKNSIIEKCVAIEEALTNSTTIKVKDGKLSITKALHTDKGIYKCIARLGSVVDTEQVTLNVAELVKVDQSRQNNEQKKDLRRNSNTYLYCHFRGDGPIKITWSRLNKNSPALPSNMTPMNYSLKITDLKFEDAGTYQCKADGPFNTATAEVKLVVYKSPVFVVKPENATGEIGQPIWVHCSGDGTPPPKVAYIRDEAGAKALNETHFETLPNGTLRIQKLEAKDAGKFICWLTQLSLYGSTTSSFEIRIKEPETKKESGSMVKTIAIAVGCAAVYILLVIGLMIYCRARRARLMKKGIITEVDDGECVKDPLLENGIPLEEGKLLARWQFSREGIEEIESLGHGKMGRVFKAHAYNITEGVKKNLVAVKEFDGNSDEYKVEFDLEVEMFSQLNHENVVRLLGITTDMTPYYIITQFSEEGDLKSHLRNTELSASVRLSMVYCIASGMEYLITLRYIHRDLAARNCLAFPNNTIKVSFLSLCEDVYQNDYFLLNDIPVPLRWLSPEAIMSENYSEKSDVWSFGVTIWEVFSGGLQPYEEFDNQIVQEGVCKDLRLPKPLNCPQAVYEIMQKCWSFDPSSRPTFGELTSLVADINLSSES